jgi:DNA-binding winged helix-turn-helix (wHTH) protein
VLRLRFGTFTFNPETRELLQGEADVHLSPKAFELLKMLLESRPRALSKAELQHHLWPDTFVSEANLPLLVGEIRTALHDAARRPRFIRTLQRFGYAFCGTVKAISGEAQPLERRGVSCWLVWKRQRLELANGENLVGREPQSAVCLDSPSVSRRHARITLTGAEAVLEDLGSKNGTYLRGTRVKASAHLRDGDPVRFGSVLATFRIWSADAPTETRRAR